MDTQSTLQLPTSLRRLLLIVVSLIVSAVMVSALVASWKEPQVASRLELYQTDLLLQANAWDGSDLPEEQVTLIRQNLLGDEPLKDAQKAYESVRETAVATLEENAGVGAEDSPRLQTALEGQAELLDLLDLRLGILQAEQDDIPEALDAWANVQARQSVGDNWWQTAETLRRLWQADEIAENSEALFMSQLQGWFRTRTLEHLYDRTQATEKLAQLQQAEQANAERTIFILAVVAGFPAVGALAGATILLFLGLQRLLKGTDSILVRHAANPWDTPWTAETIWLVLVGGFFFTGQLVMPVLLAPLRSPFIGLGLRGQALYALTYYLLMSAGTIAVLFFAIRPYRPLPKGWFQFKVWDRAWLWGIGGYLAALPLMLAVSVVNQQLWQGQGGSNPLLQTVLEAKDPGALVVFFITAAIAAPLFEELLFRGFLLPSLTRYVPVWGAILLSSFIFGIAHLSLSEVLPLTVLGMVLGVVYTRSRNLVAPMLLHSAWNSITMLGLFLLGSSAN
ncbi:MAG: type II CAAX endopeptidase family protein [Cyanobacteria bacterium J06638_28]